MPIHQHATKNDTVYFPMNVLDGAGYATDDGTTEAFVYQAGDVTAAEVAAGASPAQLSHADFPDGLYEVAIDTSVGAGAVFTAGETYHVYGKVTGSFGIATKALGSFTLAPIPADTIEWNSVALGTTNPLPNAAADAAGGLPISDAGGLDLDVILDAAITTRVAPTVAGRTLDVSAGGEAGIDWANVGTPGSTVGLSATTVGVVTANTDTAATLAGITSLAEWLGAMAGKQASDATAQTEMRATGAGSGTYDATTDSEEAQRDNTGTAGAGLTDLGGMSSGMKAEVNAEVDTALATTTYAEPGQGAPGATLSLKDKIGYLFKNWRNKKTQSTTEFDLFADDGSTVDQKATVSDVASVATKGEIEAGP